MERFRFMVTVVLAVLFVVAVADAALADDARRVRIDAGGYTFRVSDVDDNYGARYGGIVRVSSLPPMGSLGFTGTAELITETRRDPGNEVTGVYFGLGGIRDWNDRVYTYTAAGAGTDHPFVEFNAHQELNLKLLEERQLVATVGGGYVRYHVGGDAPYFAVGGAFYWAGVFTDDPNVVLQYQFRNYNAEASPENLHSHVAALTVGQSGSGWLRLRYLRGREALGLTLSGTAPLSSDHVEQVLTLEHERRITDRAGITAGIDVLRRRDELSNSTVYDGIGISFRIQHDI